MTPMFRLAAAGLMLSILALGACSGEREAPAAKDAAAATVASPDVHPFRIGALEAWALKDGDIVLPVASADLPWSDKTAVAAALTAGGLPEDQVSLSVQPLLIRDGERLVLIDSGAGGKMGTQNKLLASLRAAGVEPAQITDVLISHAHGDHVGGLADASGSLTFPHATIRMSEPEWAFARAGAEATGAGPLLAAVTPRVQAFAPGARVTPSITAVALAGHTPGHSGYEIVSGQDRLLYFGDALHSSVLSVAHPEWTNAWDEDSAAAIATRTALAARGGRLYGVHFPFPGLGAIRAEGDGHVWAPESSAP